MNRRGVRGVNGRDGRGTPPDGPGVTSRNALVGPRGPVGSPSHLEWRRRIMHFAWNTGRGSSRSSYLPHPLGRVPRELACRPRSQQQSSATAPVSITHQYHSSLARVIARSDRRPAESGTHSAAARRAPHSQPGAGALVRGRHRAVWRIGFICEAICMEGFWACVHRRVGQGACDRRLERSASRPPTADRFDLFDYRSVPFPLGFLCRRGTTFGTREGQSGGKGTGGGRRGAVEWLGPRAALDVPPPHPPPSTRRATSRPLGRSCAPTAAWLGAQTGPHPLFDAIASPRPYPGRTTPAAGSDRRRSLIPVALWLHCRLGSVHRPVVSALYVKQFAWKGSGPVSIGLAKCSPPLADAPSPRPRQTSGTGPRGSERATCTWQASSRVSSSS